MQDLLPNRFARHGSGEKFPVRLGLQVSAIKWETISLSYSVVPIALDLVDVLGYKPVLTPALLKPRRLASPRG